MRSFFKRPSWAIAGDQNPSFEFYRRADQTYEDIVAANREARIRSINNGCDSSPKDGKASKSRHMADGEHPGDEELSVPSESSQVPNRQPNNPISRVTNYSEPSEDTAFRSPSASLPESTDMNVAGMSCEAANSLQGQSPQSSCAVNIAAQPPGANRENYPVATHTHENEQDGKTESPPNLGLNTSQLHQDVTVHILISSKIANTKSLVIKRKMHQPLKDVRLAWCEHQDLPQELYRSVFLTWKGRRLFDVTTCKSLGSHTNRDLRTSTFRDGPLDDGGGIYIHMEAAMDDRDLNDSLALGHRQEKPANVNDKTECRSIRLVFKCPGHANYDLHASPQTRISQLVMTYRDAHNILADQNVALIFDGDCLDAHSCPADYDMTDDDLLDVVIK